jgi:toxin-antitoxin system PIN domain toxin
MSYSLDANILLYASDASSPHHVSAARFLKDRPKDPDLLCLTWLTLMSYQRIATHPSIFSDPLSPQSAWSNIANLVNLPRVRLVGEDEDFAKSYADTAAKIPIRGNLVPDAHLATILKQHGVKRLYSVDTDFRKFDFLEVVNPL